MDIAPLSGIDHAQNYLVPYLQETSDLMLSAFRQLDEDSECRITPAADLCIPHDVVRIAGGFATGCLVEWRCKIPIIPIDTTVNIDITSCYSISDEISDRFTTSFFDQLQRRTDEQTSYEWNFNKGNHFIASVRRRSDGQAGLFFHSNEKEFKYQYNGLMPVPGNWYWDDVKTFYGAGRYVRLLVGQKALLFHRIAKMLHDFTVLRHSFLAHEILPAGVRIIAEEHKFHYYMPNQQSVAIGCYLCEPGEIVPVLSRPGRPIDVFSPADGGVNKLKLLSGETKLVVPHGWGKTSLMPIEVSRQEGKYRIGGIDFPIEPKASLGKHPGFQLRVFDEDPSSEDSLYQRMKATCPGHVVDSWDQLAWYTKDGVAHA